MKRVSANICYTHSTAILSNHYLVILTLFHVSAPFCSWYLLSYPTGSQRFMGYYSDIRPNKKKIVVFPVPDRPWVFGANSELFFFEALTKKWINKKKNTNAWCAGSGWIHFSDSVHFWRFGLCHKQDGGFLQLAVERDGNKNKQMRPWGIKKYDGFR